MTLEELYERLADYEAELEYFRDDMGMPREHEVLLYQNIKDIQAEINILEGV